MEAVVDMTPRLRIPSSSRKEQRSLSPSLPLSFFSPPHPEMCHSLLLSSHSLYNCRRFAFTSFLFHPFLQPPSDTQRRTHHSDLWHLHKSPYTSLKTMNTLTQLHTQTLLFLPHCASVEPPTGARGEEALHHSMMELVCGCQAGMSRGTSLLCISEALQAGGVPQVQHKHSTWEEREQGVRGKPSYYLLLRHVFMSTAV